MSSRQPQIGTTIVPQLSIDQLDRIRRDPVFFPRQRLVVTQQTPPAGSVVPRGATVQVVLTDLNSIPIEILQPDVPDSLKGVKLAEIERVVEANPVLKQTLASSATVDAASAAQQLNSSGLLKTQLQGTDAVRTITALRHFVR